MRWRAALLKLGASSLSLGTSRLRLMKRVPITLENETTTPVGRVDLRVTRQNASKMSDYGGSAPNPTYKSRLLFHSKAQSLSVKVPSLIVAAPSLSVENQRLSIKALNLSIEVPSLSVEARNLSVAVRNFSVVMQSRMSGYAQLNPTYRSLDVHVSENKNSERIGACARNTPLGSSCYALTCS
uniref:Uncharacterized protein n=1 Tax=Candidatus Kentrum sp. LPFa TaxID=2126335 RepID=A0A450WN83_9GAMM|nr:MAG: hypothetical protein BECKLPF1236A_GA0070988_101996 [Candidatus Kentron sp. LPFa]